LKPGVGSQLLSTDGADQFAPFPAVSRGKKPLAKEISGRLTVQIAVADFLKKRLLNRRGEEFSEKVAEIVDGGEADMVLGRPVGLACPVGGSRNFLIPLN